MKVIGLTGGIGAGKSTVTNYLRKQGYLVIDADAIAHQITEKGSPALKKSPSALVQKFCMKTEVSIGKNWLLSYSVMKRRKDNWNSLPRLRLFTLSKLNSKIYVKKENRISSLSTHRCS